MRTFKEFQYKIVAAHDCAECHGKIICITIDIFGQLHCAYCGEIVNYPRATEEEMKTWISDKMDEIVK